MNMFEGKEKHTSVEFGNNFFTSSGCHTHLQNMLIVGGRLTINNDVLALEDIQIMSSDIGIAIIYPTYYHQFNNISISNISIYGSNTGIQWTLNLGGTSISLSSCTISNCQLGLWITEVTDNYYGQSTDPFSLSISKSTFDNNAYGINAITFFNNIITLNLDSVIFSNQDQYGLHFDDYYDLETSIIRTLQK